MKSIIIKVALLATVGMGYLPALAQPADKGKHTTEGTLDRAKAKAEKAKQNKYKDSDEMASQSKEELRSSSRRGDHDDDRERDGDRRDGDRRDRDDRDHADRGADNRTEKSTESLARRDERNAIKESYDADVKAGGEKVKGKKPWYKFWGDDE